MAKEHRMIEPFEANQVRYVNDEKVVSYGTSSYGYDIRCSDEFKIFTNVYSAIVDPKNFDPKSFVDVKADHVIIPPNSFCLARTVEYFRIPRDVLTVCLGKSTYARCFSEDTKVMITEGSAQTLGTLANQFEKNSKVFSGFSIDKFGRQIISKLDFPRFIGRNSLVEIILDNGEKVKCTPDHKFMKLGGIMVEASSLKLNDLLMGVSSGDEDSLHLNHSIPSDNVLSKINLSTIQTVCYRKITGIKELKGEHDVYCLTVPVHGNFALKAGVIVSNCGIIVNVTPFEPEWEGYVTLEFSNTTPLPAKIYANEGCAQVLFFGADEDDICETSYKDRGGKYQGQVGVTTPKL